MSRALSQYERPLGAPPLESHMIMDEETARIMFSGRIFEADNLFRVATSIVRQQANRILAENAEREAAIVAESSAEADAPKRGRLLAVFIEATTTAGEIAAVSKALTDSGIPNVPEWQLDERGVPYSIAIYARADR